MTRLVLVRHGESQAQVDEFIGGHGSCTGLSDRGREQASSLRDRLATTGELGDVAALYSSILPRAVETADIMAEALGTAILRDRRCELCEQHTGDEIDGLSWQEFQERYAPPLRNVYQPWAPGAESWAEFVARAGRALTTLAHEHQGETIVIATHGGVIDASFSVFGGLSVSRWTQLRVVTANTSITEWVSEDQGWVLARYNDAAHLAGLF